MPNTQDAYLHTIRGGFNVVRRRKVRELFQNRTKKEDVANGHDPCDHDLIVGALEEINAVGIKTFKVYDILEVLRIFDLLDATQVYSSGSAMQQSEFLVYISRALTILRVEQVGDDKEPAYRMPHVEILEELRSRLCEPKLAERIATAAQASTATP